MSNQVDPKHLEFFGLPAKTESEPSSVSESQRAFFSLTSPKQERTPTATETLQRYAAQIPAGLAQTVTWPLNLIQLAGQGEALSEFEDLQERLPQLQKEFPTAPWESFKGLDKEKYMEAVQAAGESFPTQQNLEKLIEEKTGLPLTPQTKGQRLLRMATGAGALRPGGTAQKLTAGVVAPSVSGGLSAAGVPEMIADVVGLGASGAVPTISAAKQVKPSGLPVRRYESITKPTKVSPKRSQIIQEKVEGDFKKISDRLFLEGKQNKTFSAMKEDPLFKEKIGGMFEDVEKLASQLPETAHTEQLREAIRNRWANRPKEGISPDEFEKAFRKEIKDTLKTLPYDEVKASDLVTQFRKNNASLKELYEPAKSSAQNRAKREALLEYNRAIEDVIEKNYKDTEFSKLFNFTNKRWTEINDAEQANDFVNKIFENGINYGKAKKIFSDKNSGVTKALKRSLGQEKFKDFEQLTRDLLSTENPMRYIRKAEAFGAEDVAKKAAVYLASPKAGAASTAWTGGKVLHKAFLDKPELIVTLKDALSSFKKGEYREARRLFLALDKELEVEKEK